MVHRNEDLFPTQRRLIRHAGRTRPHIAPSKSTSFRLARARGNVLDVVRIHLNDIRIAIVVTRTLPRHAYAELYITLGRVFRQFDNLKTRKKAREGLLYNDYFPSYHPVSIQQIYIERAR
jgi:hypothetical protein